MDIRTTEQQYNPYRIFTREQWARLRDDTPMTLEPGEFERLRSMHDRLDMLEVEDIYLPLSRLLSIYVDATHRLYQAQRQFLDIRDRKVPYIIGVAGSVAVGKSTTARVLQALLARWSPRPKVDLVTTDGFLFPNAVLERQGLMQKKGFPESYDLPMLLSFLSDIKAGRRPVRAPVYSHLVYDIVPNEWIEVDRPDILIVEGVNVLQTGRLPRDGKAVPVVSDFFDFSVYIDAEEPVLREWYVRRFLALRDTAFHRSQIVLQSLRGLVGRGGHGDRDRDLGAHQPRQSRGQYFADPAARDADPEKARRSPGRDGGAAAAVALVGVGTWRRRFSAVPEPCGLLMPRILEMAGHASGWVCGAQRPTRRLPLPHAAMCRVATRPASASASFSRSSGLIKNPSMPASKQA